MSRRTEKLRLREKGEKAEERLSSPEDRYSFRWGIFWLDGGQTVIFNEMLHHYHELGLSPVEMMFLIHLSSYHFESPEGRAYPSLETIGKQMGISRRTIGRMLKRLEGVGMLRVLHRIGQTSVYDLSGFARAIESLVPVWEGGKMMPELTLLESSKASKGQA